MYFWSKFAALFQSKFSLFCILNFSLEGRICSPENAWEPLHDCLMLQYCFVAVFEMLKGKTRTKEGVPIQDMFFAASIFAICLKCWKARPKPKRVYPYRTCLMLLYLCFMFEVLKTETHTKEGVPIRNLSYAVVSMFCGCVWSTERGDLDQRGCTHTGHILWYNIFALCLKCWKGRPKPKRVYPYRSHLMMQYLCFMFEVLKGETQTKEGVPIQVTSYDAISLLYVWSAERGGPDQRGCTQNRTCLMLQYLCFMFEVLKGKTQTKEGVPIQDMSYAAVSMFCGRVWSTERGGPGQRGCTQTSHILWCSIFALCLKCWKEKPRPKRGYPYGICLMLQYQCFVAGFEVLKGKTQTKEGVPIRDMSYAAVSMFFWQGLKYWKGRPRPKRVYLYWACTRLCPSQVRAALCCTAIPTV